jgi:hypothetical protein
MRIDLSHRLRYGASLIDRGGKERKGNLSTSSERDVVKSRTDPLWKSLL